MLRLLQERVSLVAAVERYEHRPGTVVEQYKVVVRLVDGSYLHVKEVWLHSELKKYAYYWLSPTGTLILGWDNAPHHPEVTTYPHHVHAGNRVLSSAVRSVDAVLDELESRLL
jgi:hypothetical protein